MMTFLDNLPFEWITGLRYTRSGKRGGRNSFISFISLISISGIGLGVAALIIVLSVMNGFEKEVTARMLSVVAHVELFDMRGAMPDWRAAAAEARKNPEVSGAAPFAETQGMLVRDEVLKPAVIRGVLPELEPGVSDVTAQMKSGSFDALKPGEFNIVLGVELARALQVKVGEQVMLAMAQGEAATPGSISGALPRTKPFRVVGVFEAGHNEFDSTLAFVHLADAEQLLHIAGPSGIRLRLRDLQQAPQVSLELKRSMPGDLYIRNWAQVNSTWFAAVQSQKRMMFIILAMIIAVAAFNLVSTLVMTVTDKQADIAILRTLGASPRSVMKIFVIQGALTGIIGTVAGVALGVLVSLNIDVIVPAIEHLLGVKFLSKDIYFISTVPSDLRWPDVLRIGGVAMLLAFAATLYPSWWAARVNPAQALRYE